MVIVLESRQNGTQAQTVEGVIDALRFHNPDNGFTVMDIIMDSGSISALDGKGSLGGKDSSVEKKSGTRKNSEPQKKSKREEIFFDDEKTLTCTGYFSEPKVGETLRLTGTVFMHPTYGRQLNVSFYERVEPSSVASIERYLASGVIKGIGERLASRIVQYFGEDTLRVMEFEPEKLSNVKGITFEKAMTIGTLYNEQREIRQAMMFLQGYGISTNMAVRIYNKYKENTVSIVKTNPYRLAEDISGVGFKTADEIAFSLGIKKSSPIRLKAGFVYAMNHALSSGHVYLPISELTALTAQLLDTEENQEVFEDILMNLRLEKTFTQDDVNGCKCLYLAQYYYAETYIARKLYELSVNSLDKSKNIDSELKEVESQTGITLADNQADAVRKALHSGVMVITGGPGTGKTTIINAIIMILMKHGNSIELAAPTGRAAKRMSEATGMNAKTIHRLLETSFIEDSSHRQHFERDQDNPIEADTIIIDEVSMVDTMLMHSLLKAIAPGTRLILVGDVDQLPSIGAGNVLKDIISSGCITVVRLTEIFRQAQESAIVMNAHRINRGEYPVINDKHSDFFFVIRPGLEQVIQTISQLVQTRLPEYKSCDSIRDIQVLTPMRKSSVGASNINTILQSKLNPPHKSKREKEFRSVIFREGDKVMQIKNNYNMPWQIIANGKRIDEGLGIFNGDEGIITRIDEVAETIRVQFVDDKVVDYDYSQLEELELSYAITIHKSQGSEYKVVVIPIHSGPPMLLTRNLLYTAVTRARELAVIVGVPETMNRMVDNDREVNRYSALAERLRRMKDLLAAQGGE